MSNIIGHYFYKEISKYKSKIAIKHIDREISYQELADFSVNLADNLRDMQINGNCALFLQNSIEYVIADLAIMFAGNTRVAINTLVGRKELQYILKDADIELIFVDETTKNIASELELDVQIIDVSDLKKVNSTLQTRIKLPHIGNAAKSSLSPAIIAYTRGTTGQPKGAVYSHEKLLLVLLSHIVELQLTVEDRILLVSPFAHSAGMILLAGLLRGTTIFSDYKFEPTRVLETIEREKVSFTFLVPTMIYRILDMLEEKPTYDVSSIKTILYGAAPIFETRIKQALNYFGPVFTQLYGQTESYNFITRLTKKDHIEGIDKKSEKLKSCGRPVLLSTVKIVNDERDELGPYEIGEVIVSSPYNMDGYYKKEQKTKETINQGWLFTGDVGYKDNEGYLYLVD